jgi:hypothetical protein
MTAIDEAAEIVRSLQSKHGDAIARQTAITTERRRIAFAAHTGDDQARAGLDALNQEDAVLVGEIAGLAAAIDEGRARVTEAERRADLEERAAAVLEVRKRLTTIRGHGASLDRAARKLVEAVETFRGEIIELRQFGIERPDLNSIDANFRRALESALMTTPLQLSHVGPADRVKFSDLVDAWATLADAWCRQHAGEQREAA